MPTVELETIHEDLNLEPMEIVRFRVPGGWIYIITEWHMINGDVINKVTQSSTFVPLALE